MNIGIDLTACWRSRVGMVTASLELASALVRSGSDSDSITLFCAQARPRGLEQAPATFVMSPHRNELLNKLYWLPRVERQIGLDAVLYPFWPPSPRRAPDAAPATVLVHDLAFRLRPDEVPWQQRAYLGSILPGALAGAHAVICPSETTRRDLLLSFPLPNLEAKAHVVAEGPTSLGEPARSLPDGLQPGYLLAVGTIERRKNYGTLLQAYRLLPDAPPLVIVGEAPAWGDRDTYAALQRTEGIILLGRVEDSVLKRLYLEAAAFVFPSLYEGFGLPLLDALGLAIPSVISRDGALPEIAAGAAVEVDPRQPEDLARGMDRVLRDSQLRAELAQRGLARAAEFSWESAARKLLPLLAA